MCILTLAAVSTMAFAAACGGGNSNATRSAPSAAPSTVPGAAAATSSTAASPPTSPTLPGPTATLVAVGDIADCTSTHDDAVAALVRATPGTVATLGDTVYDTGSTKEFARCYDPILGGVKDRTRPAAGNHDYNTKNAAGYYAYFGAAAGDPAKGYYSYDLGNWHVVVLNSNCDAIGGCDAASTQTTWLQQDLTAANTKRSGACTIAYYHHPRFSSGLHGNNDFMADTWSVLADNGVDVVLNGHDHDYERFAPMDARGRRNDATGVRAFVVGTGGKSLYPVLATEPNSEVHQYRAYGVLQLTLGATGYAWEFRAVDGATFTDSGSSPCH